MSRAELIATLFEQADELPEAERAAFLDAGTAGDASLRAELERLLRAGVMDACRDSQWEAGAIANLPVFQETAPEPADAFAALGGFEHYRLVERIGAGGMGTVYKAVRAGQSIEQIVAVKILHTAPGDPVAALRFEQERRILAKLEHPNIARMLDGGVTPDGRLFLAMEYVDGVALSASAEANKPGPRDVLRLFEGICAAVSHTHHNLVVHRDLKRGNVLVTAEGVPKLVDFGIATLSDGSAMGTRTGAAALTPEYASPEQIRGEPAGTASDIYSLGVLLYQMLTAQLPYKAETGPMALARAITLDPPVPFKARGVRIESDLELIVLKALRKEPEGRYQSVEQFWGDLELWQKGFPVSARPDTVIYRAIKLARRNPVWIAASLLAIGSIVTGSAIAVREANRRVFDTRRFGEALIFDLADEFGDVPGTDPVRRMILQRGSDYLNALAATRGNDRDLALDEAEAFRRRGGNHDERLHRLFAHRFMGGGRQLFRDHGHSKHHGSEGDSDGDVYRSAGQRGERLEFRSRGDYQCHNEGGDYSQWRLHNKECGQKHWRADDKRDHGVYRYRQLGGGQ